MIWRFLERFSTQLVSFVVSIILARILSPVEYGQIAIVLVIISILTVIVDGGLGSALIQKKDSDEIDFSSVLILYLFFSIVFYVLIYYFAPFIGSFYNDIHLIPVIRVLAVLIVIYAINNIQLAYVSKNFLFKKNFIASIIGTSISSVVGLILAFRGAGVWALVFQQLSSSIINTCILLFIIKWKPSFEFSFFRLKILFRFGNRIFLSSILNSFYDNFRQILIGKTFSPADLAFYNRGLQFPSLIMTNINTSIDNVLFPAMAEKQDNTQLLKDMIAKSINVSSFVLWPLLFCLCAISDPLIRFILTDKWGPCVPYLQVFCFVFASFPLQTANLNAIKAVGRSDIFFILEIKQTLVGLILLLLVYKLSPLWIAIMYLVSSIINCIIICNESKRLFNYGFISQFCDTFKNLVLSTFLFVILWGIQYFFYFKYIFIFQIISGCILFIIGAFVTKNSNFMYLMSIGKSILKKS